MDVLKFFKERSRMCDYYNSMDDGCKPCPRYSKGCEVTTYRDYDYIKEYMEDVEKWSKEHPQKTRLQDILEKFPKVEIDEKGLPPFCCARLGYVCTCVKSTCVDCWNMPVEEDE